LLSILRIIFEQPAATARYSISISFELLSILRIIFEQPVRDMVREQGLCFELLSILRIIFEQPASMCPAFITKVLNCFQF